MEDLLSQAIVKVRNKVAPSSDMKVNLTPEPLYKQLYDSLQVFDIPDTIDDSHVEYVYNFLMDNGGNPRDQIMHIHSELGAIGNEKLLDRVYKYCRLKSDANKLMQRYENTMRDLNALGNR